MFEREAEEEVSRYQFQHTSVRGVHIRGTPLALMQPYSFVQIPPFQCLPCRLL